MRHALPALALVCLTVLALTWRPAPPTYTLLAFIGGDVFALDTGLTLDDCRRSEMDAAPGGYTVCSPE